MNNILPMIIVILLSAFILYAIVKAGSPDKPVRKPRKRRTTGNRINVNMNGRHARTITIKAHTRTIG